MNPGNKSQTQLSKISNGDKDIPICSTEPRDEKPDCLHLDINVTKHLITVASRIYHHKCSGQPLKDIKSELDKKEIESSEAKYHEFLRSKNNNVARDESKPRKLRS